MLSIDAQKNVAIRATNMADACKNARSVAIGLRFIRSPFPDALNRSHSLTNWQDNSLRNRTWAGSFTGAVLLFRLHDAWRLPRAFAGREDGRRFRLGVVETHDQIDQVVRRREPVGLLVLAR